MTMGDSPPEQNEKTASAPETVSTTSGALPTEDETWSLGRKIVFRFLFAFFTVYIFPFPLSHLPYGGYLTGYYSLFGSKAIVAFAQAVFNMTVHQATGPNGSGDTTFNYAEVFTYIVLAAVITPLWSILDRKRSNYCQLNKWFRLYIRLFVASSMISYGTCKIIPVQFPAPGLSRMVETYGESSPMGLLWTFMGSSREYTMFTGSAELFGGLLLLIPRLTTLGALVSFAVLSNIFMLNMTYDVPVKLYSLSLLLMSIILIAPDVRRLADLLVFNRRAEPAQHPELFRSKRWNNVALALQVVFGAYLAVLGFSSSLQASNRFESKSSKIKYYGIWNVDDYQVDGVSSTSSAKDERSWKRVIFEYPNFVTVKMQDGTRNYFKTTVDETNKSILFTRSRDPGSQRLYSVEETTPTSMILTASQDSPKIRATLSKMDDSNFLLRKRGFHWINEYPFNR